MTEHVGAMSYMIDLDNTKPKIIREAIDKQKLPNNVKTRDDTQRIHST